MIDIAIERLNYLCNTIPKLLMEINEQEFSFKPATNNWSKKEIIGHLIDSATNNHQRFVRAQFEETPQIIYDQDKWNEFNFYQQINSQQIIEFWTVYNKQLSLLIRHTPKENLQRKCKTSDGNSLTLEFLINDYIKHLEHHLRQVVNY